MIPRLRKQFQFSSANFRRIPIFHVQEIWEKNSSRSFATAPSFRDKAASFTSILLFVGTSAALISIYSYRLWMVPSNQANTWAKNWHKIIKYQPCVQLFHFITFKFQVFKKDSKIQTKIDEPKGTPWRKAVSNLCAFLGHKSTLQDLFVHISRTALTKTLFPKFSLTHVLFPQPTSTPKHALFHHYVIQFFQQ